MNNTHNKLRRSDKSRKKTHITPKCSDQELDNLAAELEKLARKSLPDGVRQGIFSNQEGEIRNDAVILALQWYVRQREHLPPWARGLDDRSKIRWDADGGFFYETSEDRERGQTFADCTHSAPAKKRVDYDFGVYGILPVTLIGDQAWCSLNAAGSIAGLLTMGITGPLCEEKINVRGFPGFLEPDGLRCLESQGIDDTGIRLEALTAHVEARRRDDPSVLMMLERAIIDVYRRHWLATGSDVVAYVDLTGVNSAVPEECRIVHRFYDPNVGEMRAVVLGLQVWLRAADVAYGTGFDVRLLLQIAGPERTLRIPFGRIDDNRSPQLQYFLRIDAVEAFSAALAWELPILEPVRNWIKKRLLDSDCLFERDGYILASSLYIMLGMHLDFGDWNRQLHACFGDSQLAEACVGDPSDNNWRTDYRIAPSIACKVADDAKSFAGIVTSKLIREGGFLHSGTIGEPANETLVRFFDLAPDARGFVNLRKVWEFLNPKDTFEEWVSERREFGYELSDSPDYAEVSIWSSWCRGIWPTD